MVTSYSNYHIEVRNVKFIADDGRTCAKTAMVTFHNEEGEEVDSELFGAVDISDTIVRDIIDLEPYDFPVEIKTLDMSGMRLLGKLYIDWRHNKCHDSILNQVGNTLRQKAEQFRILKENFSGTGKYEDEDEAYIMFKRYEAKSWLNEQKEKGGIAKIASHIPNSFQWLVFDKIGLYATCLL